MYVTSSLNLEKIGELRIVPNQKCLENDPSVSRNYNFYKIQGPLLSLMSRKSTPVFDSCFP